MPPTPEKAPLSPVELPVLALRNLVLFPGVVLPIDVGRPTSLRLIEEIARRTPAQLLVATQRDAQNEDPAAADLHPIAVRAELLKVVRLSDSRVTAVLRGLERRRLGAEVSREPFLVVEALPALPDDEQVGPDEDPERLALAQSVREAARALVELSPDLPDEAAALLDGVREPDRLADMAATHLELTADERVELLCAIDVTARLRLVLAQLSRRVEVLKVKETIDTQVREQFSRQQREAVLRQKMKAIQEELGEDQGEELTEFEAKIAAAGMPADVEQVARKQLSRLRGTQSASPEYTVTRTYLEWLVELPWGKRTADRGDLAEARAILDADHYDLDKIKRRIIEYLAVRKLAPNKKAPILCLSGPPGVGKTSLGKSIARALGREFVRISLGGVRDEAEIRGHRRTYVGSLPGRIIQGIKRAGSRNPVFMLDEIDKLGSDFRGDPSAALLEVLDPEQNHSFSDHYLEVSFDLSDVIFIATANELQPIPAALRDRMEVLPLAGYTRHEKLAIARRFLLPRQLGDHGLTEHHLELDDLALQEVIEHYTHEAGVRSLERELGSVVRGVAVKVAGGESYIPVVRADQIHEYLGPARFVSELAERTDVPGVVTGLAWTPMGGEILFVEATRMPGHGNLVLTGQLGDVMKESAQAALSYVRSKAEQLGVAADFFDKSDIHLHVPAGGTPKDGPSAGVTMLSAIVSLLTGRNGRSDTAMTGEITLRGAVLPIGGVKEKVLAAHRAGIRRVILPERNRKDLVDVPAEVQADMEFFFARRADEVLAEALGPLPAPAPGPVAGPEIDAPPLPLPIAALAPVAAPM